MCVSVEVTVTSEYPLRSINYLPSSLLEQSGCVALVLCSGDKDRALQKPGTPLFSSGWSMGGLGCSHLPVCGVEGVRKVSVRCSRSQHLPWKQLFS